MLKTRRGSIKNCPLNVKVWISNLFYFEIFISSPFYAKQLTFLIDADPDYETISMIAGKVARLKLGEKIVFEDITRKKHSHPKVHWPVTARSKKKIKAFSVSSKERKQKWAKILKNLEFQHRRPSQVDRSKDNMVDYSHLISLLDTGVKGKLTLIKF